MTALLAVAVAGEGLVDPAAPVFYPDDDRFLIEREEFVSHYEVITLVQP